MAGASIDAQHPTRETDHNCPSPPLAATFVDTEIRKDLLEIIPEGKVTDIDGVRVEKEGEMVILRASQNGPYVGLKFEAKTQEEYDRIKRELKQKLSAHPEIDWVAGLNTESLD